MTSAEDVIGIYRLLFASGIQVWLTGGWGIDALLREQTRPHKDLDVIMLVDDVLRMRVILAGDGFGLKELSSENRTVTDVHENEIATAFVLHDSAGREVDAHAMRLDDQGNGVPAWENPEGFVFWRMDLSNLGMIVGKTVRCISPEMQMFCHTGYALPEEQLHDLELLHNKFGVEYPG